MNMEQRTKMAPVPIFNADRWLGAWEAAGGTLSVIHDPGTSAVRWVRYVLPKRGTLEQISRLVALADEGNTTMAHSMLPALMQARVERGEHVQEWSGSAKGEAAVNDWQD